MQALTKLPGREGKKGMSLGSVKPSGRNRLSIWWLFLNTVFSHEFVFALFVFSGLFKANPIFARFPIDLTLVFGSLSLALSTWIVIQPGFRWKIPNLGTAYLGGLFFVYMASTLIWSPNPEPVAYKAVVMLPVVALSFLIAVFVIAPEPVRVQRYMAALVGLAVFAVLQTLVAYGQRTVGLSLAFASGDYIAVGRLLGAAWLIVYMDMLTRTRSTLMVILQLLLLASFGFGLLAGGSRQTLVAAVFVALVPLVDSRSLPLRPGLSLTKVRVTAIGLLLLGLVGVFSLSRLGVEMNTLDRMALLFSGGSASTQSRAEFRTFVFENWGAHSFLGHGLGAFGLLTGVVPAYRGYPHNVVLELLMEGGLLGLVLFFGVTCYSLVRFLRVRSNRLLDTSAHTVFLLVLFAGICIMVSSTYAEERGFFSLLGLLCVHPAAARPETET